MAIQQTEKIWHNGKLIPWDSATIHVMSHVIHYGSSVFEGVRCYALPGGPAIFRAKEHMQRLLDSAKIYRIDVDYTVEELIAGMSDLVKNNGAWPCYIRPIILRGYGEAGVNPSNSPTEVYICNYPWGKYLTSDSGEGADVCVSSWTRIAPNTLPAMAKSAANYMNSQLIKMEAIINGYVEGIALDANGYVSEGSGENVFVVRNGVLNTAPWAILFARHHPRIGAANRAGPWYPRNRAGHSRANCSTSRTKSSSPAPPPKSHRFGQWTKSASAKARSARSPKRSRKSSTPSSTARSRTSTNGLLRWRSAANSPSAYKNHVARTPRPGSVAQLYCLILVLGGSLGSIPASWL